MTRLKPITRSPFFYVGDKYKLMGQILPLFPDTVNGYYEPFCGGGSSFLNVSAEEYHLNDIDSYMILLHQMLNSYSAESERFFNIIYEIEQRYALSASYRQDIVPAALKEAYKKTYFARFNKPGYELMRKDFNADKSNTELLYILLIYGFNRMLRFNACGDFNLPVGNVDLNKNVIKALVKYFDFCSANKLYYHNLDYKDFFKQSYIESGDFVYLDPPYLISNSEYNKIWNENNEKELLGLLDELDDSGVKFAISNLIDHKGRTNEIFKAWAEKFNVHEVSSYYINYHDNTAVNGHREVLVTNY